MESRTIPRVARDWLKQRLPPIVSYRMRLAKSLLIDREMWQLRNLAAGRGGPGRMAIDVGANVGLYAGILSRYFDRVIAVEPHPGCARYMRDVLPGNCFVVEKAASSSRGSAKLRVPDTGRGVPETTRGTISERNQSTASN